MVKINKQTQANKKWQEKHKERAKYLSNRSRARTFIRKFANKDDLKEFLDLIDERKDDIE